VNDGDNDGSSSSVATMAGRKRTAANVNLPPRGEIPLDDDGLENPDAFFAAAKSPASPSGSVSVGSAGGTRRAEKAQRERERREGERKRRLDELEEEGRRNADRLPEILNREDDESDDGDAGDDGWKQQPRANRKRSYQPTPKQPGWTDRAMHHAMGVPTEDSPQYTVLSRVSTAAPSTRGSVDTIATESRHGLRAEQSQLQLERVVRKSQEASPAALADDAKGEPEEEEDKAEFDGPMDPPEEMSQDSSGGEKRGVDPEERDHYLEPESQEEVEDGVSAKQSAKSAASLIEDEVSAKPSAKSAASAASGVTDPLENSLEEVVQNASYNQNYDDFDDDNEGDGGMQLATQEDNEYGDDDPNFGGGDNDGGFGENNDDLLENDDALSQDVSQASQKSRKSHVSYKSDKSDSRKSYKSDKSSDRSEISEQPLSEEEEEEEKPYRVAEEKKKKTKKAALSPGTPTSVLRTKRSKKKKQTQNRVNWSTPNGRATGIPLANRGYEAVPVSDYKEDYPPGEEPRTPGGSVLRRSRRAKFKPLQFWKNEKLIYEAQNEQGLLGEAMGDMPVVAGVQQALPTPYKEVKRKEPAQKKKKDKKRGRGDSDEEDSDDDTKRTKAPFDDSSLRKKYRLKNGESGLVWSETLESATDIKIVSRLDNRSFSKLPLSATRKARESKVVGFASQAFHVPTDDDDLFPGYIAGNVVLPPRGIKDAEGVGLCSQVFNVGRCQPKSLEFAIADPSGQDGEFDPKTAQRYLLSEGDMFQIPPGNVYRIENHSKTDKANLFWTIIKCTSRAEQEDSGDEEEE